MSNGILKYFVGYKSFNGKLGILVLYGQDYTSSTSGFEGLFHFRSQNSAKSKKINWLQISTVLHHQWNYWIKHSIKIYEHMIAQFHIKPVISYSKLKIEQGCEMWNCFTCITLLLQASWYLRPTINAAKGKLNWAETLIALKVYCFGTSGQ